MWSQVEQDFFHLTKTSTIGDHQLNMHLKGQTRCLIAHIVHDTQQGTILWISFFDTPGLCTHSHCHCTKISVESNNTLTYLRIFWSDHPGIPSFI